MTNDSNVADQITGDTVEIYWPEGCSPYTASVELSNAATHIAAHDQHHDEARLLLAVHAGEPPQGWRHIAEGEDADGDWCDVYRPL